MSKIDELGTKSDKHGEKLDSQEAALTTMAGCLEATMKRVKVLESAKADVDAAAASAESDNQKKSAVTFDATANSGAISHQLQKLKSLKRAFPR